VSGNKGHEGGKFGSEYKDVGRRFVGWFCVCVGWGWSSGSGTWDGDLVIFEASDGRRVVGGVTSRQRWAISRLTLSVSW